MLVARTIFLTPGGGLWKMFCWSIMGMLECTGKANQSQSHPAELLPVLSPPETGQKWGHQLPVVTAAASCQPDPRKIFHKSFGKASIQLLQPVAQQQQSLSQSLVAPLEHPWQKWHPLPQSRSAAAPPQESPGTGAQEFSLPDRSGSQQGPTAVLYPSFALPQLSTTQQFLAEESRHFPLNHTCTY